MKAKTLCYEINSLAFPIKLEQNKADSFCVTYGLQVDDNLSYSKACSKLGQAIMHALACDGELDNSE